MTEQYAELRGRLVVGRKSDDRSVYDEAAEKELIVACLKQEVSVVAWQSKFGWVMNRRLWIEEADHRH